MCYITIHRTLCEECNDVLEYRKSVDQICNGKRKTKRCNIQAPPNIKFKRLDSSNCLVCTARRASLEAARNAERERRELKEQMAIREEMEAEKKEESEQEEGEIKEEEITDEDIKEEDIKKEEEAEIEEQDIMKKFAEDQPTMVREKNGRVENWIDGVLELKRKPGGKK